MTEALIFDSIRTPRGKGKKSGSLHEVKPITLLTTLLDALEERTALDTAAVDDVVLGCVTAVGDQGCDIAKTATTAAGWDESVAGVTLNRFCGSGLEAVNLAAMKVRSGWEDLVVAGGVGANRALRTRLGQLGEEIGCKLFYPRMEFCTDNGAMIAYAGSLRLPTTETAVRGFEVRPRWSLTELSPVN